MFAFYGFMTQEINERVHELVEQTLRAGGTALDKKARFQNKLELAVLSDSLPLDIINALSDHNEWVHARMFGVEAKMIDPEELIENGGILGRPLGHQ